MKEDLQTNEKCPAFELAKQLHQQYAELDSNRATYIVSFISALAIVFGGYGYVITHLYDMQNAMFILLISTLLCCSVLLLITCITLFQGYALRRDQLIVYRIRKKVFPEDLYENIFGNIAYNPLKCTKKDFIPNVYNMKANCLFCINIGLLVSSIVLTYLYGNTSYSCQKECCVIILHIIIYILLFIISCYFLKKHKYWDKFQNLLTDEEKKELKELNKHNSNNNKNS